MSKIVRVAAAVIVKDEKVLIAKRPLDKHKGGYWEFPGGKIEPGESPQKALYREILEELAIEIKSPTPFKKLQFDYPEKSVELDFYLIECFSGQPKGMEGQEVRWVEKSALEDFQFPEANLPVLELLKSD